MKKKVLFLITFILLGLVLLFKVSTVKAEEGYYYEVLDDGSYDKGEIYYFFLTATKVKNLKNIINNSNTEDDYVKYNSEHQAWDYGFEPKIASFLSKSPDRETVYKYLFPEFYNLYSSRRDIFDSYYYPAHIDEYELVPISNTSEVTYEEIYQTYFGNELGRFAIINSVTWIDENGKVSEISDLSEITPSNLQTFINNIPTNYGNPDMKFLSSTPTYFFSISHTWKLSEILDKYDDEDIIYNPAIYRAVYTLEVGILSIYEVYENEDGEVTMVLVEQHPESLSTNTPTYTNYCLEGTGECTTLSNGKLANSYPGKSTCPTTLSEVESNILVSSPENYSYTTQTDKNSNRYSNRYCYYSKNTTQDNTPKYTLTIKYSETSDCTNTIRDNTVKENLTAGSTVDIEIPSTITLNDAKVKYSAVGNINPTGFKNYTINNKTLSVVIPSATDENDRNVEICLVYTPNLGINTNLIYLVFIISFGTLACSIYYFYKYFKNKKTA